MLQYAILWPLELYLQSQSCMQRIVFLHSTILASLLFCPQVDYSDLISINVHTDFETQVSSSFSPQPSEIGSEAQFTTSLLLIQMPTNLFLFILAPEPLQNSLIALCSLSKLFTSPLLSLNISCCINQHTLYQAAFLYPRPHISPFY